jgi:hypothetical protein
MSTPEWNSTNKNPRQPEWKSEPQKPTENQQERLEQLKDIVKSKTSKNQS